MSNNPSVLFICTANQCRSPMAEFLFKDLLLKSHPQEKDNWLVQSAGTWAVECRPATAGARQALAPLGIDLESHRSHIITSEMVEKFNLLLVMEHGHLEALKMEFPQQAHKMHLLSEMTGARFDIQDPIGGTDSDYQATARQIQKLLVDGEADIFRLAHN